MNTFLANITDYAMDADGNNYNMWDSNQKCNEYLTDQAYSFKILGGLFAINSAIVLDNNEMFWSRSLPQVEYALSREAEGFHPYDYQLTIHRCFTITICSAHGWADLIWEYCTGLQADVPRRLKSILRKKAMPTRMAVSMNPSNGIVSMAILMN